MKLEDWWVKRIGELEEVQEHNGSVKWRVKVRDEGREPFVTKFFNNPDDAMGFLRKVQSGG